MALRIAIVGPGRVGTAFARRFVQAGATFVGFVGRDARVVEQQLAVVGTGVALEWSDLQSVHVVIFAVGDADLAGVVAEAASVGGRQCSLWLHTSGRHGLQAFDVATDLGVRIGSLHPVMPFSGPAESTSTAGAPAVLAGPPRSMRLLRRLAAMLEMVPIEWRGSDGERTLYHAGCALAANGATSLFGKAVDLIRTAGGLDAGDAGAIVASLMQAAVRASGQHGAGAALSGPVRRGDADAVRSHLEAIGTATPEAGPAYVALMQLALLLAREQGLAPADCERVAAALSLLRPSS